MSKNLDISDLEMKSPISYKASQKSDLSQRQYEYQLSQYRMLEMQSNMLYSTKEEIMSTGLGNGRKFNRTHELQSLVTPDMNTGSCEVAKTRKREVNLPRRRSPVKEEPDPKDLKTAERNEMRDVFNEWLHYMKKQK